MYHEVQFEWRQNYKFSGIFTIKCQIKHGKSNLGKDQQLLHTDKSPWGIAALNQKYGVLINIEMH